MKPRAAVLAFVLSALVLPLRADDVLPRPAPGDRYVQMANRSPFAPPTPVSGPVIPPPVTQGPKWSDQMAVTLLTQQGSTYLATIADKAKGDHFLLQSGRADTERQLVLTGVTWGETSDLTTVQVNHNGDVAALHFDASAAAAPPGPGVGIPGQMRAPAVSGLPGTPLRAINPSAQQVPVNVIHRAAPIRTVPTVSAPAIHPPPNVARRPVVPGKGADDDDDDE